MTPFYPDLRFEYASGEFLNYREVGEGARTLVFLHGFGSSTHAWDDLLPYLDVAEYRIILIDLLGFGFSSVPADGQMSMAANAEVIVRFIEAKQLKNYVLIGHSFGGGTALCTAIKLRQLQLLAPSDVEQPRGLVLLDAAAFRTEFPFFVAALSVPFVSELLLKIVPPKLRAKLNLRSIYFDKANITAERIDRYSYFFTLPGADSAMLKAAQQMIPPNYEELTSQYKHLQPPALVIWGEHDNVLPVTGGQWVAKELSNAQFVLIAYAGHNPHEERPAQVAAEMQKFLKTLPP